MNKTENNDFISNNSSSTVTSDYSSTVSQLILPERVEPDASSSTNTEASSQQDIVASYDEPDTSSQESVDVASLNIETLKPDYTTTSNSISFTLFSDNRSNFTYYTDFFLQRYEDGKWNYVTTKSGIIDYKFNTATATSNIESLSIYLKELYETPLATGRYRIIQESDEGSIVSNEFGIIEEIPENQEEPV